MWHCAGQIIRSFRYETLSPANCTPLVHVDHIYMIVVKNSSNFEYQKKQLSALCVDTTFLTDYDLKELTHEVRSCLYEDERFAAKATKYHSQIIKLLYGLHDSTNNGYNRSLFLEDDALVRLEHLHTLNNAMSRLSNNFTIIHASSYNPMGTDGIDIGLHQKSYRHMRYRPTLMMPGVANVLSKKGVKYIYSRILPIPYNSATDLTLSDIRQKTAPQHGAYTLKPYAFTSGKFGKDNIFECITCKCADAFLKKFKFRNQFNIIFNDCTRWQVSELNITGS
jgi:hypothetical protein